MAKPTIGSRRRPSGTFNPRTMEIEPDSSDSSSDDGAAGTMQVSSEDAKRRRVRRRTPKSNIPGSVISTKMPGDARSKDSKDSGEKPIRDDGFSCGSEDTTEPAPEPIKEKNEANDPPAVPPPTKKEPVTAESIPTIGEEKEKLQALIAGPAPSKPLSFAFASGESKPSSEPGIKADVAPFKPSFSFGSGKGFTFGSAATTENKETASAAPQTAFQFGVKPLPSSSPSSDKPVSKASDVNVFQTSFKPGSTITFGSAAPSSGGFGFGCLAAAKAADKKPEPEEKKEEVPIPVGEEGEEVQFKARGKVFLQIKANEIADCASDKFVERGTGPVMVCKNEKSGMRRILMRRDAVNTLVVNAPIPEGIPKSQKGKRVSLILNNFEPLLLGKTAETEENPHSVDLTSTSDPRPYIFMFNLENEAEEFASALDSSS